MPPGENSSPQFVVYDEALYLFSTEEAKVMFEKDGKGFVGKATVSLCGLDPGIDEQ